MTTNMNMTRKSSVGLGEFAGLPGVSPGDFMAMGKNVSSSPSFPLPLSNSQIPQSNANEASLMGPTGHNLFSPNHYGQATNNFGRPFESALEIPRTKFNPLANSNMAASPSPYGPVHFAPPNENEQFPMARKYRSQDIFNVNKASEQGNYAQRPNTSNPWVTEYPGRTTNRRTTKGLPLHDQQGLVDPSVNQGMNMDQAFPNHGPGGSTQPPYQMQSQYMGGDMYKHQSRINEQHFTGRGIGSNFNPQDFFQQEQMRQMANAQQYQHPPVPRPGSNFMTGKRGGSPSSSFSQPILPKASQDPIFSQQFSGSPKANGPHPMMNMVDGRQVPFHNPNFPGSPVASQMPTKPNYPSTLGMRGTVSPNVTIGHPKKPFPPQEEGVTSPTGNQNAAAAAAAAAVRAAINAANPHTSPQSTGEMHSVPSRPPSIHGKDPGSRSPATSISDHKSESGGSGINDMGAPSPAKSLTQSVSLPGAPSTPFSSDVATTGRVPSPSVNQLPSSDIEAMIHSVSNIPSGNGISSTDHSSTTSQRIKREIKSESLPKLNSRSTLSPVTPPSPFSLSPSITVDFEDILSPSWEDPTARSTTPVSKLYKLSDEPERKEFLDKLLSFMEQQGKTLGDVPTFNGVILDLYKFYKLVSERGGLHEVIRMKMWREVVQALTFNSSDTSLSDSHFLREQYVRYLLPFETKFNDPAAFPLAPTPPVSSIASSAGAYPSGSAASPSSNPQLGNIDLSTMTYKNLRMFQSTAGGPTPPFSQPLPNQSNQLPPPSYLSAPSTPQPYPGTPPMPHQAPGYRTQGVPSMPGYLGPPSGSPRVPGYPGSPSPNLAGPGYPNHQLPGFPASTSQMPGYHNPLASQVPGYSGSHNPVPQEAMYRHEQHAEFPRGAPLGMNKHYPHMPDSQPQQSPMLANFAQQQQQQQQQYLGGMLYQQQPSSLPPHFAMDRQRMGPRSAGGIPSPKHRMQAMQSPWGQKYPQGTTSDPGLGMGTSSHSPFHSTQSPGLKMAGVRPPPPYPHPKGEMSSPAAQSSSTTYSQHQAMPRNKAGAKLSPGRSDEALFPPDCVEATKAVYSKKRRLTARDLGPVEAWRIMMSLKSGLLSETTWALDTLTILLSDDSTVSFFRLSQLPGLLDTVVEHFRRNLINVFGVLDENEVDVGVPKRFTYGSMSDKHAENAYSEKLPHLIAEENFSAVIVGDCLDDEDGNSFTSGTKNWAHGGGDTTIHIQTHFETDVHFYEGRVSKNETKCENTVTSSCERGTENELPRVVTTHEERVGNGCTPKDNELVERVNDKGNEKNRRECSRLSSKLSSVYNGVTSPEMGRIKPKSMDAKSDIGFEPKRYKNETRKPEKPKIFCNGEDGIVAERLEHERKRIKIEPAVGDAGTPKEIGPADALIRRLKAELDLDIDSVGDDVEDIVSATKMGDVRTASSEEECELKQEFPLSTLTWSQDSAIRCCICVSNILRSMSFVPGNDVEMARHPSFLLILGKLLLLHHIQRKDQESTEGQYNDGQYWWHDCLGTVRENALVTVANISGYLDLSVLTDTVSNPLLDGLLHWLVCQSADDTIRTATGTMSLSPKHLVLETLAKMSVLESNVDFILLTPDKTRLTRAYEYLVKLFSDKTNEVTREFALVLLSSLTQADESISSSCSEKNLVTVLVGFLEDAKERVEVMASRGIHPGLFHEDDMRVSMGMLRRAAGLLACIAKRTNSVHLIPFQERILALSMSRLLDVEVQSYLSDVLYNLPR